jgi:hypothetical protein
MFCADIFLICVRQISETPRSVAIQNISGAPQFKQQTMAEMDIASSAPS